MKKSLLAVAAIGAFASAAQAQSSVTVYGIVDMGYIGGNTRVQNGTPGTAGTAATNLTQNTQTSSIGSAAESTSRLGFKGSEDLGGGLSALFTVEIGLQPSSTSTLDSGATQNRQTFVGLKKNGIGQFALGTQYTTIHNAVSATDPGQANNMMGNVIYDKAAGTTTPTVTTSTQAGATTTGNAQFSGQGNNTSYVVRASNMLTFSSDNFAGAVLNGFVQAGNGTNNNTATNQTAGTVTGGETKSNGFGLGLNYSWQKLLVTGNYQSFSAFSPYTVAANNGAYTTGQSNAYGVAGAATLGQNVYDSTSYFAATYDFGILKAFTQYISRRQVDVHNGNNSVNRTAQQIGVRSYITPTIESWASAGNGKIKNSSAGNTPFVVGMTGPATIGTSFGGFQLGTNYYLSKRTNLYAIYGQQRTNNAQYNATNGPTAYNSNDYAVGVRHTF
jgi:predicted porin